MNSSPNPLYYIAKLYTSLTGHVLTEAFLEQLFVYAGWIALAVSIMSLISFVRYRLLFSELQLKMKQKRHEKELEYLHKKQLSEGKNMRWIAVENLAHSSNESDWRRAILEADNMLHELLTAKGFAGEDMGEQLRGATVNNFATLDIAWEAHRLRNRIAHEGETLKLTERDVIATIDQYRRVFEEFEHI